MMFDNNKAQKTTVSTPLPTGDGSGVGLFILLQKKRKQKSLLLPPRVFFPILKTNHFELTILKQQS